MMAEMILTKEHTYSGSLILVTPDYPIRGVPELPDLQSVLSEQKIAGIRPASSAVGQVPVGPDILLCRQASAALQALLEDIGCRDEITAVSGFRTQEEQEKIWEDSFASNGEAFTRKFVAVPGHSEHQSGYAIDLARNTDEIDFICPEFPKEGIFARFRERMARFGFIERYVAGKEEVTGIGAEPWHFRYVGYPHSVIMDSVGLALEEYIEFLRNNTAWEHPYVFRDDRNRIETAYLSLKNDTSVVLNVPESVKYHSSGTNEGGVVVSMW